MTSQFATLEDVVRDPAFPPVDLALRRGRHIDRDDGDWYAFIADAQPHLEDFYRRFGCELVSQSDGYFYLLPTGEQLARRHLSAGEMLVGQTLALQYLSPSTVQSGGVISRDQVLGRVSGLVADRDLAKALEPRRRRFEDERIVHEIIRRRIAESLRRLEALGFITLLEDDRLRLRAPLLRFADPVRGLQDREASLQRLIQRGELVNLADPSSAAESPDDPSEDPTEPEDADSNGLDEGHENADEAEGSV